MNEVVGDVDMMMSIDMTGYNLEEIMDAEIFEDELAFSSFSPWNLHFSYYFGFNLFSLTFIYQDYFVSFAFFFSSSI